MSIYYTVYRTINLINQKEYIGVHITRDLNDRYIGSGTVLKEAIKKYGKENFKKEILFIFDNINDMRLCERNIVNEEYVKREDTYNLGLGGNCGPFDKITSEDIKLKISKAKLGIKRNEDQKKNISDKTKLAMNNLEIRRLMSNKAKNRIKHECQYCGGFYDGSNLKQFHGEKCKYNPDRSTIKSEDRSNSKVTDEQRLEIQNLYASQDITYKKLGEIYSLSKSQICQIINNWHPINTK